MVPNQKFLFRIHCNNLFVEKLKFDTKYKEILESNGENSEFQSVNKTVTNLNKLFTTSGCDEQICEIIEGQLPSTVKGDALVHFNECHFFRLPLKVHSQRKRFT